MANRISVFYSYLVILSIFNYLTGNEANTSLEPIWCPESHRIFERKGISFQLCSPMSCAKTGENSTGILLGNVTTLINEESSGTSQCRPFTNNFKKCQKAILTNDQYALQGNGTLWNKRDNSSIQLGDYIFQSTNVVICASDGRSKAPETPKLQPCMPFEVPKGEYRLLSTKTVFLTSVQEYIGRDYFKIEANGSVDQVCFQADFDKMLTGCKLIKIESDDMTLLPNMALKTFFVEEVVYPIGQYIFGENRAFALVCVDDNDSHGMVIQPVTQYLYGVASLISVICLLLALLAHLFIPRLNYHTKALLCLAFSLLVMYIAISIRYFAANNNLTLVGNVIVFGLQYTFALASFLWLNVLAFDLWRVFSTFQGTGSSHANKSKEKRLLLIKCAYAWGIPSLMCITAISISFYDSVQKKLNIFLRLESDTWFPEVLGILALFYGPILIILISNATFFGLTIKNIRKASSGTDILYRNGGSNNMKLFQVYMKLFIIMGLSWFAEVVSWLAQAKTDQKVWYVSDLINCLQGVFIFLVYVCKRKTFKVIKERFILLVIKPDVNETQSTPASTPKTRKTSNISLTAVSKCEVILK